MVINLTKPTKILYLYEKDSIQQIGAWAVLRLLVSIKNFQQYKKLPWDKFVRKKRTFHKIFRSMWNFLELQCLVDDLDDFLELLMFIDAYTQYIIW